MAKAMTPEERISIMKENLGTSFVEEAKTILQDGKILKGEDARKNFNTELNELTFAIEELYPLAYEEFKKEFPKTVELTSKVSGNSVVKGVNDGIVINGWSDAALVTSVINNIKNNVSDTEAAEKEITLRKEVLSEIGRMKTDFNIEWCNDLFWKIWKITQGESRFEKLKADKGEELANKRIETLKEIGGLKFLKVLQDEVYPQD